MSNKTKTIEINPLLFSVNGLSKKNKSKNNKSMRVPLISPSILKNKLLKRIKEHKNKETSKFDNNKVSSTNEKKELNSSVTNINEYTDEFNDSIDYLQSLSKQKQTENIINTNKNNIQRRTIKKYGTMPSVNLELPDELKEAFIIENNENINPIIITNAHNINTPVINHSIMNQPINNKQISSDVPYGVLKGGNKPTYRQWNKTHKNNLPLVNSNSNSNSNNSLFTNSQISERENRLNILKQKLKQPSEIVAVPSRIPIQRTPTNLEEIMLTQNLIQISKQNDTTKIRENNELVINIEKEKGPGPEPEPEKNRTIKKILKKTIHKKYTLGKSKIKRTVGVLLKDNNTRKNVINAQKDLKNKPVNEVKEYLKQHNLIKIGSNAPNDVIRKIYESAMLAGEINNNNKDTMIHNFIKNDA